MTGDKMMEAQTTSGGSSGRYHVMLLAYVALLTTVGVALLVGISYITWNSTDSGQQVKDDIVENGFQQRQSYNVNFHGLDERVDIDVANNREVVYSQQDGRDVIMVLDFTKSLAGLYVEHEDKCMLIGGLDDRILTPAVFQDQLEKNKTMDSDEVMEYELAGDYPVTDHSLLPAELREPCRNKQVFWLRPITSSGLRQKRALQSGPSGSSGSSGPSFIDVRCCICIRCWCNIWGGPLYASDI